MTHRAQPRSPTSTNIRNDTDALRMLLETAASVELFTIPLYMTTAYSLYGTYRTSGTSQDLWPGMRPVNSQNPPTNTTERNQQAFNEIFSVWIQEMLHLQLAANLVNAVGGRVSFTGKNAPTYTGGDSIPCVGQFADIDVVLDELNERTIQMFLDIETPDWDATGAHAAIPAVPLQYEGRDWTKGDPTPTFGTIGHLYSVVAEYIKLGYDDGSTLWQKVYVPGAVQVDTFNFENAAKYHAFPEYPDLPVVVRDETTRWGDPRQQALLMCGAITAQGEGSGLSPARWFVSALDQPDLSNLQQDGIDGADVQFRWDSRSHYDRFVGVRQLMSEGIETYSKRFAGRNPRWTWQDLTTSTNPSSQPATFARERANVLNGNASLMTGRTPVAALQDALNQSYSSLLVAMEAAWADSSNPFPMAAMKALGTRLMALWAAGAKPTIEGTNQAWFDWVDVKPIDPGQAHACQGLDPNNPGQNDCAAAVIHTCANANSCENQGGCGYPGQPNSPNTNLGPDLNTCKGSGGCGAPIPVAQVFGRGYSGTADGVSYEAGGNVYETAWSIFKARFSDKVPAQPPAPNALRLILPPS